MAKRYENGRWVDVETTQTTGQSANHSQTGSALPYRPTPTAVESSSSNSDTGITEKEYKEKAYSILEGTIDLREVNPDIQCRKAVNLKGLGKVLSDTYYVTQVIVRLSPSGMTQQITVHKDTLCVTEKAGNEKKDTDDRTRETVSTKETKSGTYIVKSGDSLSKIAKEKLGSAGKWKELYEKNKSVIGSNPNLIYPGQKLTL